MSLFHGVMLADLATDGLKSVLTKQLHVDTRRTDRTISLDVGTGGLQMALLYQSSLQHMTPNPAIPCRCEQSFSKEAIHPCSSTS
jgi:hypothetical protein